MAEENADWGAPKILYFNVTRRPASQWVAQQLREAFPEAAPAAASSWTAI